jgi:hypothetical protein
MLDAIDRLDAKLLPLDKLFHGEDPARMKDLAPLLLVLRGILDELRAIRAARNAH